MSALQENAAQILSFKTYAPNQWMPSLSKGQKKDHERIRCRGFTPE